jgi:SIR2-like domain
MNVLVLGAGASLGARIKLASLAGGEPLPPLGQDLAGYLRSWLDVNDPARLHDRRSWKRDLPEVREALAVIAKQTSIGTTPPFEALMDKWSRSNDHRDREYLQITQRVIAYSMTGGSNCAFSERSDRLDSLLAQETPAIVITLNYDTLIEEALQRRSIRYTYPDLPGVHNGWDFVSSIGGGTPVPIFKLHGSVNWFQVPGGGAGATMEEANRIANERIDRTVPSLHIAKASQTFATEVASDRREMLQKLDNFSTIGAPVVALYSPGKPFISNPTHVEGHRAACLLQLRNASIKRVLLVGLRPVSVGDDPVFNSVVDELVERAAEKVYVSPSAEECEEFRRRGFSAECATLAEFLERAPRGHRATAAP